VTVPLAACSRRKVRRIQQRPVTSLRRGLSAPARPATVPGSTHSGAGSGSCDQPLPATAASSGGYHQRRHGAHVLPGTWHSGPAGQEQVSNDGGASWFSSHHWHGSHLELSRSAQHQLHLPGADRRRNGDSIDNTINTGW
jgi:hypothetical protein